jgi:hypothetical protein
MEVDHDQQTLHPRAELEAIAAMHYGESQGKMLSVQNPRYRPSAEI